MTLQDLVEKTERFNERVLVIYLKNRYALGFEKYKKGEHAFNAENRGNDVKYTSINDNPCYPSILNDANFLSDGKWTELTKETKILFHNLAKTLKDPIKEIKEQRKEIYYQMIEPLRIESVYYRNWKNPWGIVEILLKSNFKLLDIIKKFVNPSKKGFKITNKHLLKTEPADSHIGIKFHKGNELGKFNMKDEIDETPDLFGNELDLYLPNGLSIYEINSYLPTNKSDYLELKHFFYVSEELIEKLYKLDREEKTKWDNFTKFNESLCKGETRKYLKELLKTLNF